MQYEFIVMVACERETRCRSCSSCKAQFVLRNKMINSLLEMKTFSSNYMLLILLMWLFCYCSLCSSARTIGDGRWSTSGLLQDDVLQCNNTVQGRYLLSDSRGKISQFQRITIAVYVLVNLILIGYVCNIMAINPATTCCPGRGEQYSCQGCNTVSQCCNSNEYYVSCCLNPMQTALEVVLTTKLGRQATAGCGPVYLTTVQVAAGTTLRVIYENAYVSEEHHCFSAKSTLPGEAVEAGAEDELANVSVIVGRQGLSCETTCSVERLSCIEDKLVVLNNCAELQKYNKCKGLCISSSGPDQPAEVVSSAPKHMNPGACLYSTRISQLSCKGYHPFTRRLCPCA